MGYRRTANVIFVASAPVTVGVLQAPEGGTTGVGLAGRGTAVRVAVTGGRTTLGLGGHNTAARVAVQGGRAAVGLAGTATEVAITATPGSFTHVTVTRDYDLASGDSPTGVVYFTPSAWLENNGVTLVPAARPAALDGLGQISISLAANDDADTTPADSNYTVREEILGQATRSYRVVIQHTVGPTVDLATLPVIP